MPDMATVNAALDKAASELRHRRDSLTPEQIRWIVRDMIDHPREYGGWTGPNWEEKYLSSELCQRLYGGPVHPSLIPTEWRGLPYRTLRSLLVYGLTPEGMSRSLDQSQAKEWLAQIACNRRLRQPEWETWLNDPRRWVFRYLSDDAYQRIIAWEQA